MFDDQTSHGAGLAGPTCPKVRVRVEPGRGGLTLLGDGGDAQVPGGGNEHHGPPVPRCRRLAGELQRADVAVLLHGIGAVAVGDDKDCFLGARTLGDGPDVSDSLNGVTDASRTRCASAPVRAASMRSCPSRSATQTVTGTPNHAAVNGAASQHAPMAGGPLGLCGPPRAPLHAEQPNEHWTRDGCPVAVAASTVKTTAAIRRCRVVFGECPPGSGCGSRPL